MRSVLFIIVFLLPVVADDSAEVVFQKAAAALTAGDYGAAEKGFAAVLKSQPNHVGALGNLGVVYSRTQRSARAIEIYERALRLSPGDGALRLNLGLVHFKQENYRQAESQFSRVIATQANHRQARELLATCQIHLGKAKLAISTLEFLRKSDPRNPGVLYLLSMAHLRNHQPGKAKPLLDEMMLTALSPAQANFLLGKAYYDGARFGECRDAFLKVLEIDPNFPNAQLELGKAYVSLREAEKAQAALLRAMESDPQSGEAPYFLGSLLVNEGRAEEALVPLARAEQLKPDFWGTLYYLGKAKLQMKKPSEAISLLRRAAELNSEEDAIYYQLAQALRASGRLAEARTAMERVNQLKAKKRAPLLRGS
jgi:tetratricopeptide (TPR) repeat protein